MQITITLEDKPDGQVKVVVTPPAEGLYRKLKDEEKLSPAQAMAVLAISAMMNESRWAELERHSATRFINPN